MSKIPTLSGVDFTVLADVDASAWLDGENELWQYLVTNAAFAHRDACEFIVHLFDEDTDHITEMEQLLANGGSPELVELLSNLRRADVRWVMLHG